MKGDEGERERERRQLVSCVHGLAGDADLKFKIFSGSVLNALIQWIYQVLANGRHLTSRDIGVYLRTVC